MNGTLNGCENSRKRKIITLRDAKIAALRERITHLEAELAKEREVVDVIVSGPLRYYDDTYKDTAFDSTEDGRCCDPEWYVWEDLKRARERQKERTND